MKKRLLSLALVLVMVLSLLPATAVSALAAEEGEDDSGTKDAFGITMAEWTEEEKAAAEADLPFGTGYNTWTTLYEKNELFFSMGYDSEKHLTGLFDWNGTEETTVDTIRNAIGGFGQGNLTSVDESYRAVATAAMDLEGTGKKEYVANLALNTSNNALYLYVTDSSNNRVGDNQVVEFQYVKQLSGMQVHQLNGAFSITAGDFDGDGKDTIVVYVPQTGASGHTQGYYDKAPFIAEYFFGQDGNGTWTMVQKPVSTVSENVLQMLGNNEINQITTMKNQPMVDLVAEDTDKDGFDELIVTAGMNDVTNSDHFLESHIFIYDQKDNGSSFTWNCSYDKQLAITSEGNKRVVWASSTVGNIMVNTSTTSVDYPEIISAGFIDGETTNTQHINVDGSDEIGVTAVRAAGFADDTNNKFTITGNGKSMAAVNVICNYEEVLNQKLDSNGWTKGGFYESEDVNGLLQVQAFADRGLASAEAVFISGSVYRVNSSGNGLDFKYKHEDFNSKDDFAPGGRTLTNTTVTAVTAGNFNGNNEGREQLICVTTLKQSGKNNAYSRVYCYYNKVECGDNGIWPDDSYDSKRSSYLTEHKGNFHVSLAALDTDNDSVIAKLESIERDYSAPDVMAILESSPYFAEINDSFGNSETTYGDSKSSGSGSSHKFGFTLGVSVGYEFESDLIQSGGGFEIAVDNAFNWSTAKTTTVEIFREFRNDSGENLVVVYRCPVVTYRYVDQNGKELVVEKVGSPATSMITVDEYNEAAEQYDGLDLIDETNVKLGDPGDPFSYRENTQDLDDAFEFTSAAVENKWGNGGWAQYYGSGSIMQGLTLNKEQEDLFSYDLAVSKNVFVKVGGVTAGATYGFTYGYEKTNISGQSVTRSGAVTGAKEDGYDFQWKFAAWNCTLNGSTVPVLGYLVKDVVAPPSPAMGLTAESFTTNTATLRWSSGIRPAEQYRIYRVLNDTDSTHVPVGAVQGDQTRFQLTGLKPGVTYTYVVRGVDFVAGKAVESVDSAPITVHTQSEDSKVTLSLHSSSLTGSTLQSTDAAADLSVQVTGTGGNKRSYQWQLLEAGAAGIRHGWLNVDTLDGKTIGTVDGATGGSLTLQDIDESLNGSSLRCVVTVTTTPGDVETYYSPVVTLDLSGLDTTTALSVTAKNENETVGGNGSIATPYTGMANHTTVTPESSGIFVNAPVTVTDAGMEYTIHKDAENNKYVGVHTDVSTGSRTYCAVDDTYAPGSTLKLEDDQYILDDESEYEIPKDFNGTSGISTSVTEGSNTVRYEKRYVVGSSGSSITLTEYWFNTSDGQYYTKSGNTFTLAESQPVKTVDENGNQTGDDLRKVYSDDGSTVILSAVVGTDDYDHYQVYTVTVTETETVIAAGVSFHREPGTMLYKNETEPYADSAKLTLVTKPQEVYNNVTTPVAGTQLNLSASVKPSGGTISFTITNTDTGVVTQITADDNDKAVWTAPKAGLYRIVATTAATATTKASSDVCYYRADDPNNSYRLKVMQGDNQVTNISYSGNDVKLVLEERTESGWSTVNDTVTYLVNGETITGTGNSYTPGAAGSYTFSAQVDGKTVATAMLVVNKVPITVTPTWEKAGGATNTVPAYSDIGLVFTDAQGNQISGLDDYMKVSCSLYDNSGAIASNATSGSYTVTPDYVNNADKKAEFLSRYIVTINTDTIYYFSDKIAVHFQAGENGNVFAYYIDPSGDEFPFSDGSQVSMDYGFKFVAEPSTGWSVETWKVTAGDQDVTSCFSRYIDTLLITSGKMDDLKDEMDGSKTLNVLVTFTNQTHKITYDIASGSGNGSLKAEADGVPLISGTNVASDATVAFIATPVAGKTMVGKWIVDGKEYTWPGTNAPYRENTLTLKNISADHDVQVSFTTAANTDVEVSAVDAAGASYSGATITVTDAQRNTLTGEALASVPQSNALTFTAQLGNSTSAVVKKWQTSTDNKTWTTVTGSGGKDAITIYEHGEKLYVRVVIAVTQTYKLSWSIAMADGNEVPNDAATLTAASNGVEIATSGAALAANIPVDFTLTLDDAYELVGWSENVTASGNTATLSSLTKDTTVTVTVRMKPTVTINYSVKNESATGGSLTAQVDSNTFTTGGSARYDQTVTFTAAPADGYRVKAWTLNGETWTNAGTNTEMTLDLSSYKDAGQVTVTVEFMPIGNQITCSTGENGSIESAKIGNVSYDFTAGFIAQKNAQVDITAAPYTGYEVKAWKVNDEPVEGETGNTFTYTANGTTGAVISVEFQPVKYTVNWSAQNGTVTAEGQTGSSAQIRGGENVTFTAVPGTGYVFDHWTVNGVELENATAASFAWTVPTGAKADTAYDICAVFVKATVEYTVTYSAGENGTISTPGGETGSVTVASGGSVTFTATPNANYMVKGWKVGGNPVPDSSNQKTFTLENVREDCTVTVEFEAAALMKVDFAVDGDHGTLTAQADGTALTSGKYVSGGSKLVFTATPADGYMVESWTVNGVTQSERSNTLTIDSLTGNVTVKVSFKQGIPLTIDCGKNGTLTVKRGDEILTNGAALQAGDALTITATPASGYELDSLTVNGKTISSGASYTVTADDTALTIAATFKQTTPSGGGGGGGGGAIAPSETVIIKYSVNGKVTADNKTAAKGDTVTLTVTPDKGYTLETLLVTDKNGGELKLTEKNGKYTFTMPASNVTVKATFMEDNSMLNFFVDVPADAYYYDAVLWAVENGITSGVDDTHFAPNATCTRAQAVTFLWRAAGSPEPESSEMTFTDVAEGSYYHDAVLWAVENGITKGTSDTTFSPDATCSRGQIVTFLWRSLESPDAGGANPFTDVADDAYYADAVLWAVENGITTGTTDTTFSPSNDCTRAQIVTFLWRALAE
ncbi:InlB B-repeat-containing protein [Evtepia sp.]|uniref:InlB B-repeat-containing protein n=1 Tax=Evtepia sp. TaxID=2773933 RepID=UPI003F13BCB5